MYISCLLIEVGDNPDRPRPGRIWLRNLYHVHQRLCMAFPSKERKDGDPDFLAPYTPEDFPEQRHLADKKKTEVDAGILKQVHTERKADSGFLFRVDPDAPGRAVILVQSALKPDWDYAFHNAGYLLAAPPDKKQFEPSFTTGQRLRFRLLANPTRRLSKHSLEADGKPVKQESIGKRVPVPADRILDWLIRHAETGGFSVASDSVTTQPGYIYVNKTRDGKGQRLRSVRFDGTLEVTDADKFCDTLVHGIGSGKGFGFGLLSVAPL